MEVLIFSVLTYTVFSAAAIYSPEAPTVRKWCETSAHIHSKSLPEDRGLTSHAAVRRFQRGTSNKRKPQVTEYPASEGMPRAKPDFSRIDMGKMRIKSDLSQRRDVLYDPEGILLTELVGIDLGLKGGNNAGERLKRMVKESKDNTLEGKMLKLEELRSDKNSVDLSLVMVSPVVSSAVLSDVPTGHKSVSPVYTELKDITETPEHMTEPLVYKTASRLARSVAPESGSEVDAGTQPESETTNLTFQELMSQMLAEIEKSEQEIKEDKSALSSLMVELSGNTSAARDIELTTIRSEVELSHSSENAIVNSRMTSAVTPLAVRAEHTLPANDSPVLPSTSFIQRTRTDDSDLTKSNLKPATKYPPTLASKYYYENGSNHKPEYVSSLAAVTDQSDADNDDNLWTIDVFGPKVEINESESLANSGDVSSQAPPHPSELVSEATLSSSFEALKKFAGHIKSDVYSEDPTEDVVTETVLPMRDVMKMLQSGAAVGGNPRLSNKTLVVGTEELEENKGRETVESLSLVDGKSKSIADLIFESVSDYQTETDVYKFPESSRDFNERTGLDHFSDTEFSNSTLVTNDTTEVTGDTTDVTKNITEITEDITKVVVEDRIQEATTDKALFKADTQSTPVKTTSMSGYESNDTLTLLEMTTLENSSETSFPKIKALFTEMTIEPETLGSDYLGAGEPEHQETGTEYFEIEELRLGETGESGLRGTERTEETTASVETDINFPEVRKNSNNTPLFFQPPGFSKKLWDFLESEHFGDKDWGNLSTIEDYDETREANVDSVPKRPLPMFLRFLAGQEISSRKGSVGLSTEDSIYGNEETGYVNLSSSFSRRRPLDETDSYKGRESDFRLQDPISVAQADLYNPLASQPSSSSSTTSSLPSSDPLKGVLAEVKALMQDSSAGSSTLFPFVNKLASDVESPSPSQSSLGNEVMTDVERVSPSQPPLVNEVTTVVESPSPMLPGIPVNHASTDTLESTSLSPTSNVLIVSSDVNIPHPVSADNQAATVDQPLPVIELQTLSSTLLTEYLTDPATVLSNITVPSVTSNIPIPLTNHPAPKTDSPVMTTESMESLSDPRISSVLKDQTSSTDESAASAMDTTTLDSDNLTVVGDPLLLVTEIPFWASEATTVTGDSSEFMTDSSAFTTESSAFAIDSSTSVTDVVTFQDTSSEGYVLVSELSTITDEDNSTTVLLFGSQGTGNTDSPKGVPVVLVEAEGPKVKKVPTNRHDHSIVAIMSAVGCMGLLVVLGGIAGVRKAVRKRKKSRFLVRPRFFHRF